MIIGIEDTNMQIDCEEYNMIYPEESEFWAWVESMEQDYIRRINFQADEAAELDREDYYS